MLLVSVTHSGRLHVEPALEVDASAGPASREKAIIKAFSEAEGGGLGPGLLHLAIAELQTAFGPELAYARDLAREYVTRLCHVAAAEGGAEARGWKEVGTWTAEELAFQVMRAPPMKGSEYLTGEALGTWWGAMDAAARTAAEAHPGGLQGYLRAASPLWRMVGRVTFHLAENKKTPARPFAFLATYAQRVSAQARVQHQPLGAALRQYGSARDKERLIALLTPIDRAAEKSAWVKSLVDSGDVYHALAWTPAQAYQFLREVPALEASGLLVRVPDWWKANRPPRVAVSVRIGEQKGSVLGLDSLLDFSVGVAVGGQELTKKEIAELLAGSSGLVLLKGQWVEVDKEKLAEALAHWNQAQAVAGDGGVTFLEAMRMLSGVNLGPAAETQIHERVADWSQVAAGEALGEALRRMRERQEGASGTGDGAPGLKAVLRPYQQTGLGWLDFMTQLGLGACLADDMGLGKTVQVLALLMKRRAALPGGARRTSVLVVPASLLGNWKAEIAKFAPQLSYGVAHPSESTEDQWAAVEGKDLLITTYGMLVRAEALRKQPWDMVILDEAQAIKNSGTRQARAVKELQCHGRIALTGTPVENRLSDLWSLFDFLNPGLLGPATTFGKAVKAMEATGGYAPLRTLVQPYILRRLKTDKRVIADLPEKTEVRAYCTLTKRQGALYAQSVEQLAKQLEDAEGIQRRGLVLAYLMRFKQICNHPSQWLGDNAYESADSGKFARLTEICEELAQRQEKVLVFTQFREMTEPLNTHLAGIFGQPGLILHGQTPVGKRRELVESFQEEEGPPFFVLSLKAGGTGLNLTAATQVIHFDRWWNPAVENQATDRAFRIGQKKNVLVHKFVCRGTLEERIDELIAGKASLSQEVLEGGAEKMLTEMKDEELLNFVSLDIHRAEELT